MIYEPLSSTASTQARAQRHAVVLRTVKALLADEDDWIAALATIACELHHAFEGWHWTGFYRVVGPELLKVGPYQGGHGCLEIPFHRGVCGAAATARQTQLVPDVHAFPSHIACASTTQSEIVVPVLTPDGRLLAVLDVDSDLPDHFDEADQSCLEQLCSELGARFADRMDGS